MSPMPPDCPHERSRLCRRTFSNGVAHIAHQCLDCGSQLGTNVPRKSLTVPIEELPPWDEALPLAWSEGRSESCRALAQANSDAFWSRHQQAIASPHWRRLRDKVLLRSAGTCEGCGERPVADLHHLTYERLGSELLIDVVGVCAICHSLIHPHRAGLRERVTRPTKDAK